MEYISLQVISNYIFIEIFYDLNYPMNKLYPENFLSFINIFPSSLKQPCRYLQGCKAIRKSIYRLSTDCYRAK